MKREPRFGSKLQGSPKRERDSSIHCEEVSGGSRDSVVKCEEVLSEGAVLQYIVRKYQAGAVVVVNRGPGAQFEPQDFP